MPMILKSVDITKTQKSRYLKSERLFFLQIKKIINYTSRATLLQKNSFAVEVTFKMLGLTFFSKLDWGSYIISIAKTPTKEIGALIRSMKFLSPEIALFLYKSTIQPCMESSCHVWVVLLVATWDCWISCKNGYAGLLGLNFLLLLNPWLIVEMQPVSITLVDVHLNLLNWFLFLILDGGLLIILIDCMIFLSPFLDVTRMSMSTVSFLAQMDSGILCP